MAFLVFILMILLIAYFTFCAWLGWTIGESKGLPTLGCVLGIFFGPLGWITISVMPATTVVANRERKLQAMENAVQMARLLGLDTND